MNRFFNLVKMAVFLCATAYVLMTPVQASAAETTGKLKVGVYEK